MKKTTSLLMLAIAAASSLAPTTASACAACYGKSDSPLALGMTWGILSLLAVVVCVLGTFAAFFVYLARRAAAVNQDLLKTGPATTAAAPLTH